MNPKGVWTDESLSVASDVWDWEALSERSGVPCSAALIERYVDRWSWAKLSANEALPWSQALLDQFVELWDWDAFAGNESIPWSEAMVDHFIERLKVSPRLKTVSPELVGRHPDYLRFRRIEGVFSREPEFHVEAGDRLSCFNLTSEQVRQLMSEFMGSSLMNYANLMETIRG
jgi:hypothetical protein